MRRTRLAIVVMVAGLAGLGARAEPAAQGRGLASFAPATEAASLHVAFVPNAPGARTTVELSLRLARTALAEPSPLRYFALRLPAGMGIATTTLGQANCQPAALIASGIHGCSANALLGYGSASAVIPEGDKTIGERATLYALMGPAAENAVEVLLYMEALSPVFDQQVLPASLTEDVPPFGEQLRASVPLVQAWPEGPDLALQSLSSTLGPLRLTYHRRVGARSVAFHPLGIRIPRLCPPGGYPFAAVLGFLDGAQTTVYYRVPCSRG